MQPVVMLVIAGVAMFSVIGGVSLLSHYYTLNGIKSRTVGDGQHGTARFATKKEIAETYVQVPYEPELWRRGENLPTAQGLVLGSMERVGKLYALVDTGDVHCLMIGAAGVGKSDNTSILSFFQKNILMFHIANCIFFSLFFPLK